MIQKSGFESMDIQNDSNSKDQIKHENKQRYIRSPSILDIPKFHLKILNKEAEGEIRIKSIEGMKIPTHKLLLYIIFSIFTIGILALFSKWFIKIRKWLLYQSVEIEEADYFFITSSDEKFYIEKKEIYRNEKSSKKYYSEEQKPIIFFKNNFLKYVYNSKLGYFECSEFFNFDNPDFYRLNINNIPIKGLDEEEIQERHELYGRCELDIPVPSFFSYMADILIGPFYIIQYLSIILWIIEENYLYSIVLLVVSIFLVCLNYIFVLINAKKIKTLTSSFSKVRILREFKDRNRSLKNNEFNTLSQMNQAKSQVNANQNSQDMFKTVKIYDSSEIVPGDIFLLEKVNINVPCDCILISGDALVNESMLNGECTPVAKHSILENDPKQKINIEDNEPLDNQNIDGGSYSINKPFSFDNFKNNILFDGTKILELKKTKHEYVLAMALRTGFTSLKGQLVRSVLFPKKLKDTFSSEVLKFISLYSILFFIIFIVILIKTLENKIPTKFIIFRLFDGILYVIPPTLTIYLSCCTTFSIIRLKFKKILGLQPEKIIPAGKIEVCCFDKTGTLTKNDIDIIGFLDLQSHDIRSDEKIADTKSSNLENKDLKKYKSINHANEIDKNTTVLKFMNEERADDSGVKDKNNYMLRDYKSIPEEDKYRNILFKLFASCHSIYKLNEELVGDSLDLQMFKFSNWKYYKSDDPNVKFFVKYENDPNSYQDKNSEANKRRLNILKINEFSSELLRMSVVSYDEQTNKTYCFIKGAPEIITKICIPNSVPENEKKILEMLSIKGFRIIGMAYKDISHLKDEIKNETISRNELEDEAHFLGFLISENKLKSDTSKSILRLKEAEINIKIVSGDNPLTTIQASKEANIIDKNKNVLLIDIVKNKQNNLDEITYKIINSYMEEKEVPYKSYLNNEKEHYNQRPLINKSRHFCISGKNLENGSSKNKVILNNNENDKEANLSIQNKVIINNEALENFDCKHNNNNFLDVESLSEIIRIKFILDEFEKKDKEFAITGNFLDYLMYIIKINEKVLKKTEIGIENINILNIKKDSIQEILKLSELIFIKCKVFSRMKPYHKAKIVEFLQKLNLKVAMIGDGANDCSALKQADIGISFSEADASFSAPFSSLDTSISCVEKVLLEGRATLLNYIEVFRYIMSTAFIKYFAIMLLTFSVSYISDFQFFFGNFLGIILATVFLGASPPADVLTSKKPPQSLIGFQNIMSIYGQNIISALCLITVYLNMQAQGFYKQDLSLDNGNLKRKGIDNTAIIMSVHVLFMISNYAFMITSPFKKRIYRNYPLFIYILIILIYNTILLFKRDLQLSGLDYVEFPSTFNINLFLINYGFGLAMIIYEEIIKKIVV